MEQSTSSSLIPFGRNIWIADGPHVTGAAGFHFPTRMAVIRFDNRDLAIWSPVAITASLRQEIESLGRVAYLLPPNTLHHSFLEEWHLAYPDAEVFAPPGLSERRLDIRFTGELDSDAIVACEGQLDVVLVRGNRITTEAVFFHHASRTAIFTDLIQNFDPGWFKGWRRLVAKLDLMTAPEPSVPRKFRLAFTDRKSARSSIEVILSWPVEQVVFAHGQPIRTDASAFLRRAFIWLAK